MRTVIRIAIGGLLACSLTPSTTIAQFNWSDYRFAFGASADAQAGESFAFGSGATALSYSAPYSSYPSHSIAFGAYSIAGPYSIAIGPYSYAVNGVAIGNGAYAEDDGMAFGSYGMAESGGIALGACFAFGFSSVAALPNAVTSGGYSVCIGVESYAGGDYTVVFGGRSTAMAWGQIVFGSGNAGKRKDGSSIVSGTTSGSDPIYEFARSDPARGDPWGEDLAASPNALTIYRDGQAHFSSVVRVKPAGDIPMTGYQSVPSGVQYP